MQHHQHMGKENFPQQQYLGKEVPYMQYPHYRKGVRQSLEGQKECPKESKAQLDHQDQRDLRVLQGMDCLDLRDNLDLLVHQECLEWENQVCQDCPASQEEMVTLDHKEKWVLEVKKGQLGSQGLRVPQDHLGCQE
ncbi:hypothetical protein EYF80_035752 [Liparis tanakae]|uniref:Uncharacterized protein n=1 Tax=Liparis tanakae TaxID=230148 RepID=A0A4Z2GLF9_9TELE|nr:hypothetical protein EYF80_035752 [Liparis tanakae]